MREGAGGPRASSSRVQTAWSGRAEAALELVTTFKEPARPALWRARACRNLETSACFGAKCRFLVKVEGSTPPTANVNLKGV